VMNGVLTSGSAVNINVTKSKSVLEETGNYEVVNNATVILTNLSDGATEQLTYYDSGNYRSSTIIASAGKNYQVSIKHPSLRIVHANALVPQPVAITSIDTTSAVHFTENYLDISVGFTDNSSAENFYELQLLSAGYYYYFDTLSGKFDSIKVNEQVYFQVFDKVLVKEFNGSRFLVSDEQFNNQSVTITASLYYDESNFKGDLIVVLSHVSKAYYQYFVSLNLQSEGGGKPSGEPVPVYSNTSNDMGILGASSISTAVIVFK
jgi:hypothetical protein